MDFNSVLYEGLARWGLPLSTEQLTRLNGFSDLLLEKNRVMNLTAITEPVDVAKRHMLDCLFLLTCGEFSGKRIIDIGCGAGFPSMPLLCFNPELDITALDSTAKRIGFISEASAKLGLKINAVAVRAEEYITVKNAREGFELALSRAVAPLNILCELCLPYVALGGVFMPMKSCSDAADAELLQAQGAIAALGGVLEKTVSYSVGALEPERQVLIIRKASKTPDQYPRRFSKISAKPL